ncbi:GGDEF domain-containing protein [Paenibacillus sp. MWE-103]|uniref:GGDEF domain-containing protein n=1 Tax=Paenibacillus artemisiicola TaxID=1172618 RepID=A0ABS3WKJ8_9BACL|nr:GGDEF domain-containing protein [Paenibacillus artemisiicola]MBO7748753.1 GGDEF domain-containing protein [Paenibacillus artemisiicola]
MAKNGQVVGAAAALGMTAASAGLCYMASQGRALLPVEAGLGAFAAVVLSAGWLLGRCYDRLKTDATVDALTGVYNRRFIETTFRKLQRQASRKRKRMAVMLLDVNDFKDVNDRFGHQQGDSALALIAETLRLCAERGEFVGRWGGDEFILICPYADDKAIERITKRIHDQLLAVSRKIGLRLSVSTGCSVFPDHGKDLGQLTLAADKKMYADKYASKTQEAEPAALQA